MTTTIRFPKRFIKTVSLFAKANGLTISKQIERWAYIGMSVDLNLGIPPWLHKSSESNNVDLDKESNK